MSIFYAPDILDALALPEEESQHAVRVLRLRCGDPLEIVDGLGGYYTARVTNPDPHSCGVEIVSSARDFGRRPYRLHIAIAPTKNMDRIEWFVEKAAEIGIDQITPLLCQHSERRTLKTDRLEKILVSAIKQSQKAYMPVLDQLTPFNEFVRQHPASNPDAFNFICHCHESQRTDICSLYRRAHDAVILVGPEGDFDPEEVSLSSSLGYRPVTLGNCRLRTETAGVVACDTVAVLNRI